jgi:hypothetical protein
MSLPQPFPGLRRLLLALHRFIGGTNYTSVQSALPTSTTGRVHHPRLSQRFNELKHSLESVRRKTDYFL